MVATINSVKVRETQEKYRQAAFAAYLSGAAGESGITFQEYIEQIGLADGPSGSTPMTRPEDEKITKEQALAKADAILALFQEEA